MWVFIKLIPLDMLFNIRFLGICILNGLNVFNPIFSYVDK